VDPDGLYKKVAGIETEKITRADLLAKGIMDHGVITNNLSETSGCRIHSLKQHIPSHIFHISMTFLGLSAFSALVSARTKGPLNGLEACVIHDQHVSS
jgi:hypothetical protein